MIRTFYGDESGSITQSKDYKNRFFIIGFISVNSKNDRNKLKRIFRNSKKNYLKHNTQLNLDIKKEIKGSEMPLLMKKYIFEQMVNKATFTFNYAIVDNHELYGKLQTQPHITFNYIIDTYFKENHRTGITNLNLHLDDRNKAVGKLKDLQNYLQTSLFVNTDIKNVFVDYHNSHDVELIQIADIFCNFMYKYVTYYMNAKKPKALKIREDYLEVFTVLKNKIECYTSFPKYRSSYNCPH